MMDILSFNTFVTQDILMFFYYVGAVVIPIVLYFFRTYLIDHIALIKTGYEKLYDFYSSFSVTEKKVFWFVMISMFVCMELCWRMMFEAMIGYFDMHDYLHIISQEMQNAR
jgi:phage-related holin